MKHFLKIWLLGSILVAATCVAGSAKEPGAASYYLIGNSLTWDTVPEKLAGDVQWHVDCGVTLPYIQANPDKPCVATSTLWPKALRDKQYDVVSVQPHYGTTVEQDADTISAWMQMQPSAVFVIHSGWAFHANRADELEATAAPTQMTHSPGYVRALVAELRRRHPAREIRQTMAQNLLAQVADDIATKKAPFDNVESLYRDVIHLTKDTGRYLAHNAMRQALGQPLSAAGFDMIDPAARQYFDGVLALLATTPADRTLLTQILAIDASDRPALVAKLSDKTLQQRMTALLPEIERVAQLRPSSRAIEAETERVGGKLIYGPSGPQWLYLVTGDIGTEIFDVPIAIDLYNGNNPLKGQGGRNEMVTDDWLKRLSAVTTLRRLDLANCAVQGDGLQHIGKLTGLRELNLTLSPVTDDALKHIGGLTELRMLGLASTQCTGTGFAHLKGLRKLDSVNFHFTPLNDDGLRAISEVPISGRLWFAHTHFTDAGSASLAALTQLKRCGIGSKEQASSGEAVAALEKLPLEDLALLDNQATPSGVAHAAKIATLKKLDVSYGPTVGDDSLKQLTQMPQLEELRIGSAQLTDEGIQVLATSKSLKKLFLSGMKQLTPAGVDRLRQSRPELVVVVD